ncbi:MAG: response regulator [Rhodanobacteraceae bacterium]
MKSNAHRQPPRDEPDREFVIVVDYDAATRASLGQLFTSAGFGVELYASAPEMLADARLDRPGCLVLETTMPHMSGFEVQARIRQSGVELPVVFLTAAADVSSAVAAMREGAADFIGKPFDPNDLVARVRDVILRDAGARENRVKRRAAWKRLNSLTPRECSVLDLVVAGKSSKEIARTLQVSHRTIDIHRLHVMEKLMVATVPELIRMRLMAIERRAV